MRCELTLFDASGERKYLCAKEVPRFLRAAQRMDVETDALCRLLVYTGCRLSEALALTPRRLDPETGRVVFRTLKRRHSVFRAVPVPPDLMLALRRIASGRAKDAPLWRCSRQTAWRRIKRVMSDANIDGAHAMPKGLRHGFGVANAELNVPMSVTKNWLGHAKLETTAIYQQATGREERAFAARLWRSWR
jgi:integrase/recombinase XerD